MALPKRRKSHAKVRTRQQQWRAKHPTLSKCSTCGATFQPHHACLTCGFYNGRPVLPAKGASARNEE